MFWNKKKKVVNEPTESDYKFDIRLRALEEETHQLISEHNFGEITDEEFENGKTDIRKRLDQFKEDYFNRTFDELMGNPMQQLDRIFGSVTREVKK